MLAWCDFPLSLYTDYANPGQPPVNEVNHFSCVRREKRLRRRRRNDDDGVRATRSAKSAMLAIPRISLRLRARARRLFDRLPPAEPPLLRFGVCRYSTLLPEEFPAREEDLSEEPPLLEDDFVVSGNPEYFSYMVVLCGCSSCICGNANQTLFIIFV